MEKRKFSRFKPQRVRSYQFIAVPKMLFSDPQFMELSLEARWLYIKMLDRASLSADRAKHQGDFVDENGDIFIIYSNDEIAKELRCGKNYVTKYTEELSSFGLIEKKHRGQGKPTVYYVMDFATLAEETEEDLVAESEDTSLQFSESLSEGIKNPSQRESRIPVAGNQESPYEGGNKNKESKNESSNPSSPLSPHGRRPNGGKDCNLDDCDLADIEDSIKNQIEFDVLIDKGYAVEQVMEIVRLMMDMLCRAGPIKLGQSELSEALMKKRMRELTHEHIVNVLDTMENATDIQNPRAYLLTLLYNAPTSTEFRGQVMFNNSFVSSG